MTGANAAFRLLPQVDEVLRRPAVEDLLEGHSRESLREAVAATLEGLRDSVREGRLDEEGVRRGVEDGSLLASVREELRRANERRMRRVVNATGVVLHTGLGRAPVAEEAARAAAEALAGYCLLEVDAGTGKRGRREEAVAACFRRLVDCEAATVVNNNAAAVLLALHALANGKEVVLSRGELVEIGGSFRMPEVMEHGGVLLVEVGTTNRTYLEDYRAAVTERTGCLLKVHRSNFRIEGFVHETSVEDLSALGRELGVPVLYDLGSGLLAEGAHPALRDEPLVSRAIAAGCDLVTFSGDKLLGGPQCGVLAGKREAVETCRSNALFRALRPDKATLAALEATLLLYLQGARVASERVPTLRLLGLSLERLDAAASSLATRIHALGIEGLEAGVEDDASRAGSGSAPEVALPTRVVTLAHGALDAEALLARLRCADPPVFGRARDGRVVLDPRTLLAGDEERIVEALARALRIPR